MLKKMRRTSSINITRPAGVARRGEGVKGTAVSPQASLWNVCGVSEMDFRGPTSVRIFRKWAYRYENSCIPKVGSLMRWQLGGDTWSASLTYALLGPS